MITPYVCTEPATHKRVVAPSFASRGGLNPEFQTFRSKVPAIPQISERSADPAHSSELSITSLLRSFPLNRCSDNQIEPNGLWPNPLGASKNRVRTLASGAIQIRNPKSAIVS